MVWSKVADLPKLLQRCCALGIDPNVMSPVKRIQGINATKDGFSFKNKDGFSPISQPIGGRLCLN